MGSGRLADKVALITGASSGIGRAIGLRFAQEGSAVVNASRGMLPREGGEPTHELIRARGGRAVYTETDVTSPADVQRAFAQTLEEFGDIHIVVTSAGVVAPTGDSRDVDPKAFDDHFAVNVRGTFLVVQQALKRFVPAHSGKVITVASNFGLVGVPQLAAYCASKAAVIGMTRSLAVEFGPMGVNANVLCPGATKTEINAHFRGDADIQAHWRRMTPLRMEGDEYIGEPPDIADAAVFLASDESRFMTGACLVVDGGWIAQ